MPVSIAQGWDVAQGVNLQKISRLAVTGTGRWHHNSQSGLTGFNGIGPPTDTTFLVDSRAALDAMVTWLTGDSGAKDILILSSDPQVTAYGTHFTDGLTALGHTYDLTGSDGGSNVTFGNFDPQDYDLMFCQDWFNPTETYKGMTNSAEKFDYLLTGGLPIHSDQVRFTLFGRYGFDQGSGWHSYHWGDVGPPDWHFQMPFYCSPWGVDLYKLVKYTTGIIQLGTNTMGGTSVVYDCEIEGDEGVIGLWDGLA